MKAPVRSVLLAVFGTITFSTLAQQAPAAPPVPAAERPPRREGLPGGAGVVRSSLMRGGPLMQVLDTDKNGELSAAEIAAAATALKTLDKNSDGKLSADELRASPGAVGPGAGVSRSVRAEDDSAAIARLMANDKNSDGKLTAEELPARMKGIMARADADKDGFLTQAELEKALATPPPRREGGPSNVRGDRPAEAK
jgi:hypothetical protein